jgi:hypothetical protein
VRDTKKVMEIRLGADESGLVRQTR